MLASSREHLVGRTHAHVLEPRAPVCRQNVDLFIGFGSGPAMQLPATGEGQRMRTVDIDDGQLQVLPKRSFGYGFPHRCMPARICFCRIIDIPGRKELTPINRRPSGVSDWPLRPRTEPYRCSTSRCFGLAALDADQGCHHETAVRCGFRRTALWHCLRSGGPDPVLHAQADRKPGATRAEEHRSLDKHLHPSGADTK